MQQQEIQERWLNVDGMRIHCLVAGESGPPVVLLHGAGIDSATLSWSDFIVPLSAHHRVFAPDLPGYGLSEQPHISYTTDFYVDFLGYLLAVLQLEQASLVGLSLGGGIALSFTLRCPEQVEKLVLVDPYGIIDGNVWPRWLYLLAYLSVHYLSWLNEPLYPLMAASPALTRWSLAAGVIHDAKRLSPALVEQVRWHARLPGRGKAYASWQKSELLWRGPRTCLIESLDKITIPTLLVQGEKDRGVPLSYAQKAHERIANSQLYVLKNCGHWPQREMPEEFDRAVEAFLLPAEV